MTKLEKAFADRLRKCITALYEAPEPEKEQCFKSCLEVLDSYYGICPRCGFVNSGGKFCSECGQELAGEVVKQDSSDNNIESVDYLIAKKSGNVLHILTIADDEQSAMAGLRKQLTNGINVNVYKRTVEKLKVF